MSEKTSLESEVNHIPVVVDTDDGSTITQRKKQPKRILHFSDGTLEEYSTDEDETDGKKHITTINTATLKWTPWLLYQALFIGKKALNACDYMGESLANFFGILTPKYQSEIDHFKEMQAEEDEIKKQDDLEMGSWKTKPDTGDVIDAEIKTNEEGDERY